MRTIDVHQPGVPVPAADAAQALHEELRRLDDASYGLEACGELTALIDEIGALERERDAVIMAHNYRRPEIFEVADVVGDSLELAREATEYEVTLSEEVRVGAARALERMLEIGA
jgi:quinolinate synthase